MLKILCLKALLLLLFSNQKYRLLVLFRLLMKNADSCRSRLMYSRSCTPLELEYSMFFFCATSVCVY